MTDAGAPTCKEALSAIGMQDGGAIHVADAALWLAKWTEPDLKIDAYRRHLQTLVQAARAYVGPDPHTPGLILEATRQILARRYGYGGITDPGETAQAANLARVIDHRRGGAHALCILYAHVLGAFDIKPDILDFPARALVAVADAKERVIIDPFAGGRIVGARALRQLIKDTQGQQGELTPDGLMVMDRRAVLLALQHDIKIHHLKLGAPEAALHIIEGALLIAPNDARLWRELGLLHARLDHVLDAIDALETFLRLPGSDAYRYTASQMVQQLRRRLDKNNV